eukprot:scaffold6174_cov125-Isochrysis_galbana.AAC.14
MGAKRREGGNQREKMALNGVRTTMAKVATRRAVRGPWKQIAHWQCTLARGRLHGAPIDICGISGATGLAKTLGMPGRSRPMPAPLVAPRGPGSAPGDAHWAG